MKRKLFLSVCLVLLCVLLAVPGFAACKHEWTETARTAGNCQTKSTVTMICTLCGETKVEEGKLGDHLFLFGKEDQQEATCTESGKRMLTCLFCKETKEEVLEAPGHSWNESGKASATCTAGGTVSYICTRCGETKTEEVAALGHDFSKFISSSATCTEKGQATYQCTRCGELTLKADAAHGHDYEEKNGATCTESGRPTLTCRVCGATKTGSYQKALGHDTQNANWSTVKKATCTAEGQRRAKCARCKEYVYEDIPKLTHEYGALCVVKLPTATSAGKASQFCENCGESKSTTIPKNTTKFGKEYEVPPVSAVSDSEDIRRGTYISLSCVLPEAEIYYTLNGKNPATASSRKKYTEPILITDSVTLKAVAEYDSIPDSEVKSYYYDIDEDEPWVYFYEDADKGGYMSLDEDGCFRPDDYATRYEVIEALDKLFDSYAEDADVAFGDVDKTHKGIVKKFIGAKLLSGYEDGTFRGKDHIKRSEFSKLLTVALGLSTKRATAAFKDLSPTHWAYSYIAALTDAGYLAGDTDGNFRPEDYIKRAELATVLNRIAAVDDNDGVTVKDVPKDHWAHKYIGGAVKKQK